MTSSAASIPPLRSLPPRAERLVDRARRLHTTPLECLAIAHGIVRALRPLHARGRAHGALRPDTVVLGPGPDDLALDNAPARDPAGRALHYIAPEQTGHLAHAVDARADFYALGVVLYELSTGARPVGGETPRMLDVVHAHLARMPAAPASSGVPRSLSDLIMRLLAKAPEDRYQTLDGLAFDLEACAAAVARGQPDEPIVLGQADRPPRLVVPSTLFGRDEALARLDTALALARAGRAPLVVVDGPSGVGKSALVAAVRARVRAQAGRFGAGKFDQLRRGGPYSALAEALRALVFAVLASDPANLEASLTVIRRELGPDAPWLLSVVPEAQALVGSHPPPPRAGPAETQARIAHAIARCVRVLAGQAPGPLVLFVDDLQWADAATLEVLRTLLLDERGSRILVICARRSEALDGAQGAASLVADVARLGVPVDHLALGPLAAADTAALVRATLHDAPGCAELAALVHQRTEGNPLFVGQLLSSLASSGLLRFAAGQGHWTWDTDAVRHTPRSDSVLDLVTARLVQLPADARHLLALATLLGGRFDLETLALIADRPRDEVTRALALATESGFLDHDGQVHGFVHDRVQQAAALPITDRRESLHAAIAQQLLDRHGIPPDGDRLHALAAHAVAGARYLDAARAPELATLLVRALRSARAAAAFTQAAEYGERAAALLGEPAERFEILLEVAECWGAAGELERAFTTAGSAAEQARTPLQSARACATEVVLATTGNRHEQAIDAALRGLRLLGISLRRKPPPARVALGLLRTKLALARRTDAAIESLPSLTDARARVVAELLLAAMAALFQTGDLDLFALCCFEVLRTTLTHGHGPGSGFGFVCYGMVSIAAIQDYAGAERFGRLGVRLADRHGDGATRCRAQVVHGMFVQHWTRPRAEAEAPLAHAHRLGCEAGEMAYAGYAYGYAMDSCSFGPSLELTDEALVRSQSFTARSGDSAAHTFSTELRALYRYLREPLDPSAHPGLPPAAFEHLTTSWRYWWFSHLLLVGSLLEHAPWIAEGGAGCDRYIAGSACSWQSVVHQTYAAVADCRAYPEARGRERRRLARKVASHRQRVARWATACPSDGPAYLALVDGARCEAQGQVAAALAHYEVAVERARAIAHRPVEIMAARSAARLAVAHGRPVLAQGFRARGAAAATAWGARALPEGAPIGEDAGASPTPRPGDPGGAHAQALRAIDAEALTLSMHALSRELSLAPLMSALLDVALRATGATRGALVRPVAEAWRVVATAEVGPADGALRVTHGDDARAVPAAILRFAAHREGPLVLADARSEPDLGDDPYVRARGSRSLLVLPVIRHGRSAALLLLENELVSGAFTPERVRVLEVLSAQIGISLENAELYEDLKQNNVALVGALEDARTAARAKSVLLANVSHELRTPLNGVVGLVELLADAAPPSDLVRSLDEACTQLVRQIGGLIAYSEAESGNAQLDLGPFDVVRMLTRTVESQRRRAEAQGLTLALDCGDLSDAVLRGDSVRLGQVIGHLLDNAIGFTVRGGVVVRIRGRRQETRCALEIEVHDSGCGMSPDVLARAFEPLQQADSSSTKRHGGLGIGLAQARRAIELMGGTIELRSQAGQGTVARVELTLDVPALVPSPDIAPAVVPAEPLDRALVLVAEDNVVNQRVLTLMLKRLGLEHRVCSDGLQVVEAYRAEGPRVRCVLMDCQMPNMDGFEATLRIRAHEQAEGWPRVPIVAVTANALATDRDKCLDAGMDGYIAKPVRLPRLQDVLAGQLAEPG